VSGAPVARILEIADSLFPFERAEPWDNCGLQIGEMDRLVTSVAFSLDPTPQTVAFAEGHSCQLLVVHHPLIMEPLKSVSSQTLAGRTLLAAARAHVDILALHTNFDAAPDGLNDWIAARLGLDGVFVPVPAACARMGKLPEAMAVSALTEKVARDLETARPRVVCDGDRPVKNVFCASGSGMGYLAVALGYRADVMITGDVRYHAALEAREMNMPVIDAGHFGLEQHAGTILANAFRNEFAKLKLDIACLACDIETDPYRDTSGSQGGLYR